MIITHRLEMDMTDRGTVQRIDVVQGDCNSRCLALTLLSGGEAWAVPEDAAIWMRYCKSDGTKGIYDTLPDGTCAWSVSGNVVTVALAPQMLTAAGPVLAQLELVQGVATLATFSLQLHVERNPAAGALTSEEYINMLQWMEGELDRLLLQAKESGEFNGPQSPSVFDYAVEAGYTGEEADFQEQLITPCLPLAGGTMQGAVNMGGQALSGLSTPAGSSDAVTKAYVDQRRLTKTVTLRTALWSSALPYTQYCALSEVQSTDWIHIEPAYTGLLETDLAIKAAFACISYAYAQTKYITVQCFEEKPEVDLKLYVEVFR